MRNSPPRANSHCIWETWSKVKQRRASHSGAYISKFITMKVTKVSAVSRMEEVITVGERKPKFRSRRSATITFSKPEGICQIRFRLATWLANYEKMGLPTRDPTPYLGVYGFSGPGVTPPKIIRLPHDWPRLRRKYPGGSRQREKHSQVGNFPRQDEDVDPLGDRGQCWTRGRIRRFEIDPAIRAKKAWKRFVVQNPDKGMPRLFSTSRIVGCESMLRKPDFFHVRKVGEQPMTLERPKQEEGAYEQNTATIVHPRARTQIPVGSESLVHGKQSLGNFIADSPLSADSHCPLGEFGRVNQAAHSSGDWEKLPEKVANRRSAATNRRSHHEWKKGSPVPQQESQPATFSDVTMSKSVSMPRRFLWFLPGLGSYTSGTNSATSIWENLQTKHNYPWHSSNIGCSLTP
uniref:Uncharacterized protein n=1 Tax=Cannabis sativa TaxID=3483 RepID=A0A803NHZ1_CANSA